MNKLLGLLGFFIFFAQCKEQPPPIPTEPVSTQWYCSTLGYHQHDTTGANQAVSFKTKFWPVAYEFKVGFIQGNTAQMDLVKKVCKKWSDVANLKFTFPASGPYDIRVSFDPRNGAWSHIGIDNSQVKTGATMNLGWLVEAAYLHEFGHAINLLHEHQNPSTPIPWNRDNVIKDLSGAPNYWSIPTIEYNVLNTHLPANVITTALDKQSIMMYPIPVHWTTNGFFSTGGQQISTVDAAFVGTYYPFTQPPVTGNVTLTKAQVDLLLLNQKNLQITFDETSRQLTAQNAAIIKALGRSQ